MSLDPSDADRLAKLEQAVEQLRLPKTSVSNDLVPAPLKEKVARLDAHIRFEFDLTAQRVAYLATSQAFMFTAYSYAIVNLQDHELLNRIIYFVPRLGVVLSFVVLAAVVSAMNMTFILKKQRHMLRNQVVSAGIDVDERVEHFSWQHWIGLLPPLTVTGGFTLGWLYVGGWIGCS